MKQTILHHSVKWGIVSTIRETLSSLNNMVNRNGIVAKLIKCAIRAKISQYMEMVWIDPCFCHPAGDSETGGGPTSHLPDTTPGGRYPGGQMILYSTYLHVTWLYNVSLGHLQPLAFTIYFRSSQPGGIPHTTMWLNEKMFRWEKLLSVKNLQKHSLLLQLQVMVPGISFSGRGKKTLLHIQV